MVTHLTTTVFVYRTYHPEDGRITGRNMLGEDSINKKTS